MKTNIVIDISPPIPYLVKFWVSSYGPKCCQPMKWMMKFIFGIKINIKAFYKLILSFWVCAIRHTQSTQIKSAYFSNISRKAWEMKLIFCLQINTSFLQVDSIILGVLSQACQKHPKQQVYNIFPISQRKCEG